jgi:hypothetical protein
MPTDPHQPLNTETVECCHGIRIAKALCLWWIDPLNSLCGDIDSTPVMIDFVHADLENAVWQPNSPTSICGFDFTGRDGQMFDFVISRETCECLIYGQGNQAVARVASLRAMFVDGIAVYQASCSADSSGTTPVFLTFQLW